MKFIDPEYLEYTSTGLEYINPDYWKMIEEEFEKMTKRNMLNSNPFDYPHALSGIDSHGNLKSYRVIEYGASYESFGEPRHTFECIDHNPREVVESVLITQKKPFFPPEKVIFNPPATIVFWSDGTKTVVKCNDEKFDEEKGLAMAISKKALGNKGNYYNHIKKFLKEEESIPRLDWGEIESEEDNE